MRRLSIFLATIAIATAGLFIGSASVQAPSAKAWAWKDTCTMFIFNKTGAQTNVRPILYTPVMPNPASMAQYAIFAATGIPTSGSAALTNTGIPVTWGCHAFINFANPGPTVSCEVSAPTKGANTFSCSGNVTTRIIEDDDDIAGNIFIPSGSGTGNDPLDPRQPKEGPPTLRQSQMPGSGWEEADDGLDDLGLLGGLMDSGEVGDICRDTDSGSAPEKVSTGLFTRRGGDQWSGAVTTRFAKKPQARATLSEALSTASVKCLRKLLTDDEMQAKARLQPMTTGALGSGLLSTRIKVRHSLPSGSVRNHYLDVLGTTRGPSMALVMLGGTGKPPSVSQQRAALDAALKRTR